MSKRSLATALALTAAAGALIATGPPAQAAGRPDFQLPTPCGETWTASTYSGHRPDNSVDLNHYPGDDTGRPVAASAEGRIEVARVSGGWAGTEVLINHGGGWTTHYAHLSALDVSAGAYVRAGQIVGRVGNTGNSTGAHLHFEQTLNGVGQPVTFNGVPYTGGTRTFTSTNNCGTPVPPAPVHKTLRWYLSDAGWSGVATRSVVEFGNTPMVPVVGDFDGNGSDTQSAYDPTTSTFYLTNSGNTAQSTMVFGVPGSRPVLGRWDGGTDQIGVYMPETGKFHLRREDGSVTAFAFGNGGDWRPVAGDWDGNGTETVGAYDPSTSTFYLRNSLSAGGADETVVFGNPNNIPITGDWDRSGRTDIGVYNPDNRTFYFRHGNGTVTSVTYGSAGDTPVTGDWDGDGYTTQGIVTTH
ncbi:VCBS repeat domain-containing M23 family metallopeptidase [Streptomyces sp. NPDC047718]|uniref:VCBS repeat domain-containing M23 family metallopeptidase n=1 Tax=Streptomyces sp. NPDC047718 TaxID=3155479 RepID=UPI0033F86134